MGNSSWPWIWKWIIRYEKVCRSNKSANRLYRPSKWKYLFIKMKRPQKSEKVIYRMGEYIGKDISDGI